MAAIRVRRSISWLHLVKSGYIVKGIVVSFSKCNFINVCIVILWLGNGFLLRHHHRYRHRRIARTTALPALSTSALMMVFVIAPAFAFFSLRMVGWLECVIDAMGKIDFKRGKAGRRLADHVA